MVIRSKLVQNVGFWSQFGLLPTFGPEHKIFESPAPKMGTLPQERLNFDSKMFN